MDAILEEIMPQVIQVLGSLILALLSWAVFEVKRWVSDKGFTEKLAQYDYLADIAVRAVEQIYINENGAEKLTRAKQIFLDSLPANAKVSSMQLDAFLESAVKRMNDAWLES